MQVVNTLRVDGFLLTSTGETATCVVLVVLVVLDVVVAIGAGICSDSGSGSLGALGTGRGAVVVDFVVVGATVVDVVDVVDVVEVVEVVEVGATVVEVVDVVDVDSAWTGTVVVVEVSGGASTGTLYPLYTMRFGDPTPALVTGVAVAVETTSSWVCAGVSVTSSSKSMATTPLTTGAAMEVPDTLRSDVVECIDGDTMSVPGANWSTHAPKFEYLNFAST